MSVTEFFYYHSLNNEEFNVIDEIEEFDYSSDFDTCLNVFYM